MIPPEASRAPRLAQRGRPGWSSRLSANLGLLWADLPIPEAIIRAGRSGFPAVELHHPGAFEPEDVVTACEAAGVRLLGVNMPSPNAALASRREQFRAEFGALLAWSLAARARAIHLLAGAPAGEDLRDAGDCLAENTAWAAAHAAQHDILILLEPLNHHDRPGWFLRRPDDAADVIAEIGRPNVGLQFDAYHTAREGLDPISELVRHRSVIRHIQIAGVPARDEPDRGDVDYAAFLAAVDAIDYDGWIGCEYQPRATVEAGLGWREALQKKAPIQ